MTTTRIVFFLLLGLMLADGGVGLWCDWKWLPPRVTTTTGVGFDVSTSSTMIERPVAPFTLRSASDPPLKIRTRATFRYLAIIDSGGWWRIYWPLQTPWLVAPSWQSRGPQ